MTTKTIYFGKLSAQDLDNCGTDGFFPFEGGYFAFKIEGNADDGECRLTDSVGRMVPVNLAAMSELGYAMTELYKYMTLVADFTEMGMPSMAELMGAVFPSASEVGTN